MTKRLFSLPLLLSLGIPACGDSRDAGSTDSTGDINVDTSDVADSSTGVADSTSENESSSEEEDTDEQTGTVVDPDADPEEDGCQGVDFLVIIDTSRSMQDEQENLTRSFPKFLTTLQGALKDDAQAFHVGVIDTDSSRCALQCESGEKQCFEGPGGQLSCSDVLMSCDHQLGGLRISSGTGMSCGLPEDRRFIDSSVDDDLESAFTCLGNQGVQGDGNEKPMEAMMAALSEGALGGDGCSGGFLRKDSILVVMLITDEEDDHEEAMQGMMPGGSMGEPADWKKAVLEAKGGDEEAVIVIGLVGDIGTKDALCKPFDEGMINGAEESPRLREFVESFGDRGALGSVCAMDYAPFLEKLVGDIESNCDTWIPPD